MVKYYEVIFYIPSQKYIIDFQCLDRQKAMEYAARSYKRYPAKLNIRFIVQTRWMMLDGTSAPEVIWEFKHDIQTKAVEQTL